MKIAVVGTGYVGLCVGTCLADAGNEVIGVDKDLAKIRALQAGKVPIYEPGLEELIARNVAQGRLSFTSDLPKAVGEAQVVFIAVPTPEGEAGDADLRYVLTAAQQVAKAIRGYTVVVNKSTVPVGTADRVRSVIARLTNVDFDVVSNPEFLKEGTAVQDFCKPDRVVIGATAERAAKVMGELYAPFVDAEHPIYFMDPRSAELTKYAANAMLATRISFMNDLARLCERVNADVDLVRRGLGADRRIGPAFLSAGVGYGGSCFPKDVSALIAIAREYGLEFDLLRAVSRTNRRQKRDLLVKAVKHYGDLEGRTFGIWGLAFKPETDDMREAPSIELVEGLLGKGAKVQVYDPVAMKAARRHFNGRVRYAASASAAAAGADGLFIVTEWKEFRRPDFRKLKKLMSAPVIFDGRNIYDPAMLKKLGFTYLAVGRAHPAVPVPVGEGTSEAA